MNSNIDNYQQIVIRLSKLCRICGDPVQNGVNIFGKQDTDSNIKEKIDIHMPIKVTLDDVTPQKLCMDCYQKLEAVHNLVVTCVKTDIRFRRYLNIDMNPSYDPKFNKILRSCSMEVIQELSSKDTTDVVNSTNSSNKLASPMKKIVQNETLPEIKLQNITETTLHTDLTNLFQDFKGDDNSNTNIIKTREKLTIVKEIGSIVCLKCKENFKSIDIFEDHKIICDESNKSDNQISGNEKCDGPLDRQSKDFSTINKELCNLETQSDQKTGAGVETEANKERRCGYCKSIYLTRKTLQNHFNDTHEGKNLFMCGICDKVYRKWSGLDIHEATHRTDKPYLCDLCGKSFKHSNNLRGHKRIHLDESRKKRHLCDICNKRFRSRFHLKEHVNSHNENRPYSCEECGKSFFKRVQLRQHKLSHGSNKFNCSICGASFNRRGNMMAHIKTHNKGDAIYTCSVCEAKCKTMSELKIHRKQHTEADVAASIKKKMNNKPTWQCKVCNKVFLKRNVLLSHERTHALNKISVECEECGKKLSSKHSLTYHKKTVHSKEKSYVCQYCGNAFASKEAHVNHERTHTGERPYACKICHVTYKCSSNLSQHMKTHASIWPYVCQYCNKGFTRKSSLSVHERTHTGIKPYNCAICNRAFAQKNDMIKHSKLHSSKINNFKEEVNVENKKDGLKRDDGVSTVQSYVVVPQLLDSYTLNIVHSNQLHVIQSSS